MDLDTPNLIDEEGNFDVENLDIVNEKNEEEYTHLETSSSNTSAGKRKGFNFSKHRRRAKCWKHFTIGKKHPDGKSDVTCNHCKLHYCLNLRRNGTTTLNRHMGSCSKIPGGTPRSSVRKLDMMVFSGALDKIRDSVKFVKGSQSREDMFRNCKETVGLQMKAGLVLDVQTRWNSTHLMLSRAIKYKDVLRNLAEVERSYKSFPSDLEWTRGELICELLTPFAEMTNIISGSSYPTANLYFMQVWKIESWLRTNEYSDDPEIYANVKAMRLKFDKYWEEYRDILAIDTVFDPRLKFDFLEYCFSTLDSSSSRLKLAHVRSMMVKLFGAYKRDTSNISAAISTSQASEYIPSGYAGFYSYCSQKAGSGRSPLDTYLDEPVLDMVAYRNLDILAYWKDNSPRFKELATMACDVLSIPITTVASESSFSIGSHVLNKYRSCLLPTNVQALICVRNWLRGFQEIGDDFEFIEEETNELIIV